MIVHCLFDYVLNYVLITIEKVLIKCLALACSSLIYNQENDTITFDVIMKGKL